MTVRSYRVPHSPHISRWFVMLGLVYFSSAFKKNLLGKMETFLLMKQEKKFVMEPSIPDNIKLV